VRTKILRGQICVFDFSIHPAPLRHPRLAANPEPSILATIIDLTLRTSLVTWLDVAFLPHFICQRLSHVIL
jgi:hypothetical protein